MINEFWKKINLEKIIKLPPNEKALKHFVNSYYKRIFNKIDVIGNGGKIEEKYSEEFANAYDAIAFDYYNYPKIAENIHSLIEEHLPNYDSSKVINLFESASGTGNLALEISKYPNYHVEESDNAKTMYETRNKKQKPERFHLHSLPFMSLNYVINKPDVIYSNGGALWLINTEDGFKMQSYIDSHLFFQALKNLAELVKEDGIIMINIQEEDSNHDPIETSDGEYIYEGLVSPLNENYPEIGIKKRYTLKKRSDGEIVFDQEFDLKRYDLEWVKKFLNRFGFSEPIIDKEKGFIIFKKNKIS